MCLLNPVVLYLAANHLQNHMEQYNSVTMAAFVVHSVHKHSNTNLLRQNRYKLIISRYKPNFVNYSKL